MCARRLNYIFLRCLLAISSQGMLGLAKEFPAVPPKPPFGVTADRVGAKLFEPELWPLSVNDRYVVNVNNERVKFACVNWHGAYLDTHVVGGLDYWPLDTIAARIRDLGFNCVRLPYSTQGVLDDPRINASKVKKNPDVAGLSMLEMFDKTIDALAKMGLMVIINNHNSKSGWCCSADSEEGIWYTKEYSEAEWIRSLEILAERYKDNKYVVGFDIRNEPHDWKNISITWGTGDPKTDWAAAAARAGNAVLNKSPEVLVIVEGICFAKELRPLHTLPLQLLLNKKKLVYSVHMYSFFQIFTLFTEKIMSWHYARHLSLLIFIVNLGLISALLAAWRRTGYPRAPVGVLMITFGVWITVSAAGFILYFVSIYINLTNVGACRFVAEHDALPQVWISVVCFLVGVGIIVGGLCKRSRSLIIACQGEGALCDDASAEGSSQDDSGDESSESPVEKVGSLQHAFAKREVRQLQVARFDWAMHVGLQVFAFLVATAFLAVWAFVGSELFNSWYWFRRHMDGTWGFVLVSGNAYTAPVWVSELGASVRSDFWLKMMRYLALTDVDWAYWPLNPFKQVNKKLVGTEWVDVVPAEWTWDGWSILAKDWMAIRHPWQLDDLRHIMASPSSWIPESQPCNRELLTPECGG